MHVPFSLFDPVYSNKRGPLVCDDGSIVHHTNIPGKQPRCCCKNKNKKWSKGTVCCLSFHLDNKNTPVRCVDEMLMPLYWNPTGKLVSSMFTMRAGQNRTASNTLTLFFGFFSWRSTSAYGQTECSLWTHINT